MKKIKIIVVIVIAILSTLAFVGCTDITPDACSYEKQLTVDGDMGNGYNSVVFPSCLFDCKEMTCENAFASVIGSVYIVFGDDPTYGFTSWMPSKPDNEMTHVYPGIEYMVKVHEDCFLTISC